MGCWNETCGISGTPIENGDPIRAMLLVGQGFGNTQDDGGHDGGGFCYPTGLFSPVGLAMVGTYDDYGRIARPKATGYEVLNERFILEYLAESLVEGGLSECTDYEYDEEKGTGNPIPPSKKMLTQYEKDFPERVTRKSRLTFNQALEWAERGYLRVSPRFERGNLLGGWWMCHEEMWQKGIEIGRLPYEYGYPKTVTQEQLYRQADAYVDNTVDTVVKLRDAETTAKDKERIWSERMMLAYPKYSDDTVFQRLLHGNHYEGCRSPILWDVIYKAVEQDVDVEDVRQYCYEYADLMSASSAMARIRRPWMPQCGKGGQDFDIPAYLAFHQAVFERVKRVEEKRRLDREDE